LGCFQHFARQFSANTQMRSLESCCPVSVMKIENKKAGRLELSRLYLLAQQGMKDQKRLSARHPLMFLLYFKPYATKPKIGCAAILGIYRFKDNPVYPIDSYTQFFKQAA